MYVRFWGTRGSIAAPGPGTVGHGGNTSCTELRADDGTLVILDCGTGSRELGLALLKERPVRAHLLIGHSHWDHIQGFPFFVPAFLPDSEITVYAPAGFQHSLEQAMEGQMQYSYFPVKLKDLSSKIRFVTVDEGAFQVGGISVQTQYLNHTAPTIGYRISAGGNTVVYATDHEPFWRTGDRLLHPGDRRHVGFLEGADLVIHDAQYTEDEYPAKLGWGHSTADYAAEVSQEAGAGRLALFHHDPTHDDAAIERLEAGVRARAAARRSNLQIFSAREGMELRLPERSMGPPAPDSASALAHRVVAGARVVVAARDPAEAGILVSILVQDGVEALVVNGADQALSEVRSLQPDLIVLDADLFPGDPFSAIASLKAEARMMNMPVLLLSSRLDEETIRRAQAAGATDCLAKPFSPPMAHARIRAWLARFYDRSRSSPDAGSTAAVAGHTASGGGEAPRRARRKEDLLSQRAGALAGTPLFGAMAPEELQRLAARCQVRTFAAGETIARQGEKGDYLFVIMSGRVRIVGRSTEARAGDILLSELGAGEVFGELAILDDAPRSASAAAVARSRCLLISREAFLTALEESPALTLRLARMLARRLREADQLLTRDGPDALTGLMTRRNLEQVYRREAATARRRGYSLTLLFLDIDSLRSINERYSHLAGDEILRVTADALSSSTRESDVAARVGDDEFAALLLDTTTDGAQMVKARVERRLQELVAQRGLPDQVSCTVGWTSSSNPPVSFPEFLQEAKTNMESVRRARAHPASALPPGQTESAQAGT